MNVLSRDDYPMEVAEILQYQTTTQKSPTPGVRIMFFLATDGKKYVTALHNPYFKIRSL